MTMSEVRSTTEAVGHPFGEPVALHPDDVSEGGDDKHGGHVEQISDLQYSSDPSGWAVSDLSQIPFLCEEVGLDVPTTVLQTKNLIAQGLAAISEASILSGAITAGSDAFKVE